MQRSSRRGIYAGKGNHMRPEVIAEAGVNHNGKLKLAMELVDAAARAGADVVKFQTFKADLIASEIATLANYQKATIGAGQSQLEMLRALELSFHDFETLKAHCDDVGIEFLSTAFDHESLSFLSKGLGLKRFKIPSGEITNAPLLLEYGRTAGELILSTGMSTIDEVKAALSVISFGFVGCNSK